MSKYLKEVRELTIWIFGEGTFQEETKQMANTKVLEVRATWLV